ncbi:MAG: ATP-dependent Clp protease proteolytic subunit [Chloroflexi bacterium]|nr:ATP-dependent Clp protease proteolytic subunit [Chloroflexota bacterium]
MFAYGKNGFAAISRFVKFNRVPGLLLGCYFLLAAPAGLPAETNRLASPPSGKVFIVPIRENIMPPLVYVVRRGVKEAMEAKAGTLILDMNTDGGRVDVTEEIIQIISKFPGLTVTYVNDRAFSAGAFIAVGTQKIYMAPQSVIGAAAPILMAPGGGVVDKLPDTMEAKMTSANRALVRVQTEKNGHNIEVVEAMIDKTKELKMDGEVLNKAGNILTLTDRQAAKEYGNPPKPLLSSGTVESLDALLAILGHAGAQRVEIKPTGTETLGIWINAIGPLLLIVGMIGLYIEFKTPGFGLPGIIGIVAFALYFFGGYTAGLSGAVWAVVFVVGLILVALELFVFQGSMIAGIGGAVLMLVAIVMGVVDMYPGTPRLPTLPQLQLPLRDLGIALAGTPVIALLLARFLPKTLFFPKLVSQSASGVSSVAAQEAQQEARIGQIGVALSPLCPGGKAQFGDQILDVLTQGEMIERGRPVKIIGHTGADAVVEEAC